MGYKKGDKMKGKTVKRMVAALAAGLLLVGSMLPAAAAEPFEEVGNPRPSGTDYAVDLRDVGNAFIGNETPIEMKQGSYFYLVYTVAEVEKNELWQNGLAVTSNNDTEYVFDEGTMQYDFSADKLLEPGCTYFIRYEMTEEGLSYVAAKANATGEASYIEFSLPYGDKYDGNRYFGIWLGANGGRLTAKLTQVLCYDENGNDLGVKVHTPMGGSSVMNYDLLTELDVQHSYEFSLKDASEVAISNERPTSAETVFMSYTVKNVEKNVCNQTGGACTTTPTSQFPHGDNGILNYEMCENEQSSLLHEGSHYLLRFDRNGGELRVMVKEQTGSGAVNYFGFPIYYGTYRADAQYFALWFGEGNTRMITADFVDFKCYDENGKNLAVQLNRDDVSVRHIGNLEDYTLCKGVYYAEKNHTFMILDDECNIGRKVDEKGQDTIWGTYVINQDKLTMTVDGVTEEFTYLYDSMTDKDGVKYIRLRDQKVKFVTGDKDQKGDQTVSVTAAEGYKVQKPEDPSLENLTFKEWCLGDGKAYDFDTVVTKSMTLYAKYVDGDGHEYLSAEGTVKAVPTSKILTIVVCVFLALITAVICVLVVRRGKKYE